MARLFFALWPDASARDALAKLALDVTAVTQGRAVPAAKIHLTLAFLGEVVDERRGDLEQAAGAQHGEAMRIILDRAVTRGEFPGSADRTAFLESLIAPLYLRALVTGKPIEEWPYDEMIDRLLSAYAR